MFARALAAATLALTLGGATTKPFALPAGPPAKQFAAACANKDGWADPAPPVKIFANVYHIGTCGIVVLLIASPEGHVVIDSGPKDVAPQIIGNIRTLGFDPADVKWLLNSHEHHDHVGSLAELKRITGARLAARAAAKGPLERGTADWRDPQAGSIGAFPGVSVDRVLTDGEQLVLGPIDLTVHATPGHAPGSSTWSWRSCEGRVCHDMVFADSVSALSADKYKFSQQRVYVDAFARSLGKIAGLPCDLLITPHPGASALHERLAGTQPLSDPDACLKYAQAGQAGLEKRLTDEGAKP